MLRYVRVCFNLIEKYTTIEESIPTTRSASTKCIFRRTFGNTLQSVVTPGRALRMFEVYRTKGGRGEKKLKNYSSRKYNHLYNVSRTNFEWLRLIHSLVLLNRITLTIHRYVYIIYIMYISIVHKYIYTVYIVFTTIYILYMIQNARDIMYNKTEFLVVLNTKFNRKRYFIFVV